MLDTCVTPISHELYAWGTAQNSFMFAGFALVGLLSVCTTRAAQRFAGRGGPAAMRLYPRRLLCTGLMGLGAAHVLGRVRVRMRANPNPDPNPNPNQVPPTSSRSPTSRPHASRWRRR